MDNSQKITHISPSNIRDNVFDLIGKDWMLITAKHPTSGNVNTMTASWGTLGILWGKPVAICFIRPERHTYEFAEASDHITLSFFTEDYRKALQFCGSHSGRDVDKFAETGLTLSYTAEGVPFIPEARMTLICRKLYADDLREGCFIDQAPLANYKSQGYHRFYICEILDIWTKE